MTSTHPTTDRIRRIGLPLLAAAGGVATLGALRERLQHRRVFLPDRYPNGVWNPEPFGLSVRDCWLRAADGVDLHGWWIPHRRAHGTLLFCHGNSGSIAHQVGVLRHLGRLRVNILAFDYRGYGRSSGTPSERGLYLDVRGAFAFLTQQLGQPATTVILFGHSLGGAVAIDAARDCPAAGLVAQSTFTHLRAAARAATPSLPLHWIARRQFRSLDKVGGLDLPKLFIHGEEDGTLPVELGRRLFEAAAEPKELYLVPHAGHNDVHRYGGLRYLRRIGRFRDRCLAVSRRT
jgi:uncharacterized protein